METTTTPLLHVLVLVLFLLDSAVAQPILFDPINPLLNAGPVQKKPNYETSFTGNWELVRNSSDVSAMHLAITKENKAILFDATNSGPSLLPLPAGNCRPDPTSKTNGEDCWAHAAEYDFVADQLRPLKVGMDCFYSCFASVGPLGLAVTVCAGVDEHLVLVGRIRRRWDAGAVRWILPDGSFIVVGGRREFSYEFIPAPGQSNPSNYKLPFLIETTDDVENNLYPFVHLSTDGNLFIFANNRSILLDPRTHTILREFPPLKDGSHNYPASASSALLPIRLRSSTTAPIPAEVIICGGASHTSAALAAEKMFIPALRRCSRLTITKPSATWHTEVMPTPRVMADMLLLPNADVLIINGASKGTSGWGWAVSPNLEPLLYRPSSRRNQRFMTLAPTTIPRMYHSTSAVLPDTSILVAGSNPNSRYNYTAEYPTEFRLERFYPPYLDPELAIHRPRIVKELAPSSVTYGASFQLVFDVADLGLELADLKVTMYAPPFTTHGISMNQRLLILSTAELSLVALGRWTVAVTAPPTGVVAPPGYYLLFVVNRAVPASASSGTHPRQRLRSSIRNRTWIPRVKPLFLREAKGQRGFPYPDDRLQVVVEIPLPAQSRVPAECSSLDHVEPPSVDRNNRSDVQSQLPELHQNKPSGVSDKEITTHEDSVMGISMTLTTSSSAVDHGNDFEAVDGIPVAFTCETENVSTSHDLSTASKSGGALEQEVVEGAVQVMKPTTGAELGRSMQKQIEGELGVKIVFPSSKDNSNISKCAVKSPKLDYSHFISLPLALHPELVEKLNRFQNSIFGDATFSDDDDLEKESNDGTTDDEDNQSERQKVAVKLEVQDEKECVKVKINAMDYKSTTRPSSLTGRSSSSEVHMKNRD
ncbi:hypothetical protein GW17_00019508 [Ensete ventricosum]|nr:hypothetical protein GW17_00019508 [Ensete ventricosum]